MPEEKEYISKMYDYVGTLDKTYKSDISLDQFKTKMSDEKYAKNIYDWVSDNDKEFSTDVPFDSFIQKLGTKKKTPSRPISFGSELPYSSTSKTLPQSPLVKPKTTTNLGGTFSKDQIGKQVRESAKLSGDKSVTETAEVSDEIKALPKKTKQETYQYAIDANITKIDKIAAEFEKYKEIDSIARGIENGEIQLQPEELQQFQQEYNAVVPIINKLNSEYKDAVTKVEFFGKAKEGEDKLQTARLANEESSYGERFTDVGMNQLGSIIYNSLASMSKLAAPSLPPHLIGSNLQLQKMLEDGADKSEADAERRSKQLDAMDGYVDKDMVDVFNSGGVGAATEYALKRFTESVPITLGIMGASMTGGGGAVVANSMLFSGTAYDKYRQFEGREDMTEEQKVANALGTGAVELLFEGVLSTGMGAVYKEMYKSLGKEAAQKAIKKSLVDIISNGVKKYVPLSSALIEGLGEGATQLSNNLIDKFTDPKAKDLDPLKGVVDAFGVGMVGGGAMGTPVQSVSYINRGASYLKNKELTKQRELLEVAQETASPETQAVLQDTDAKLQEQQNDLALADRNVLTEQMTDEEKDVVKDLYVQREKIENSMAEVDEPTKEILSNQILEINNNIDKIYDEAETRTNNTAASGLQEGTREGVGMGEEAIAEVNTEVGQELSPSVQVETPTEEVVVETQPIVVENVVEDVVEPDTEQLMQDEIEALGKVDGDFQFVNNKDIKGKDITIEVEYNESGKKRRITANALELQNELKKRVSVFKKLSDCIG